VHADADAFATSDVSLLVDAEDEDGTTFSAADGGRMRFAAESFLSFGAFEECETAEPTALLAGTVLAAETRVNELTRVPFHVVDVTLLGFGATVCLPVDEHPACPSPGNVVAGEFYLVASADALWSVQPEPQKRRPRWRRWLGR